VEHVLAPAALPDAVALPPLLARVHPLADEDAREADLAAAAEPHAHGDLVEPLAEALLEVDVSPERLGDGG
jgi:hypothetical protein